MRFSRFLDGDSLRSRVLRGTAITLGGTVGQQLLRLISNLILTRLLFPEAFGLMALIQTFMTGLAMFSDLGTNASIIQNRRGEEPDFLNTAWTIQIGRGFILWLATCALAWPLAGFYGDPRIMWLLPVVGLNVLIAGFATTKSAVASRRIHLGLPTAIALGTQVVSVTVTILLAWIWPSVWALVIGGLVSSLFSVLAGHRLIPGTSNRLRWDPASARDLVGFGRFIFLSTMAGFLVNQGDKLFLGKTVSLADLGIYNIAFFMAAAPAMLGNMMAERILFPLYREIRPSEDRQNRHKTLRARNLVAGGMLLMLGTVAIIGDPLISLLYDPRYQPAGPMLIILALAGIPAVIMLGNAQLLLAEGNSRDFFRTVIAMGALNLIYMFGAFWLFGIFGVLLVPALNALTVYPLMQSFVGRHGGRELSRDAAFAVLGLVIAALAIWLNRDVLGQFYLASRAVAPSVSGNWHPVSVFGD